MSWIWIERLAVVLMVVALAGCATSKEKLLTHGDQTMLDIWNQETGGPAGGGRASRELLDARQALRRPLTDTDVQAAPGVLARRMRERRDHFMPASLLPSQIASLSAPRDAMREGATDYLLKPFDLRELAARLHTLMRRMSGRSVNLIEHGRLSYDPSRCEARLDGRLVDLSRREQALLQALLNNQGRVLSSEQLKDAVYGFADDVESNALNVHIHHLRRKLGSDDDADRRFVRVLAAVLSDGLDAAARCAGSSDLAAPAWYYQRRTESCVWRRTARVRECTASRVRT